MTIEAREAQILRVRSNGIYPELSEKLSESLRLSVVKRKLNEKRQSLILGTPAVILVDGVWVDIQYAIADEYKEDRSGHLRQCGNVIKCRKPRE